MRGEKGETSRGVTVEEEGKRVISGGVEKGEITRERWGIELLGRGMKEVAQEKEGRSDFEKRTESDMGGGRGQEE